MVDTDRETNRWTGVAALAFVAGTAGVVFGRPAALLLAVVGVAYAAYAQSTTPPEVDVRLERELSETEPRPDEEVDVTLSVVNEGESTLPDLRLVDGVPDRLEVTEGTARLGTALRPGERDSITYTVEARRGVHEFDPTLVLARNWSGAAERETERRAETTLTSIPDLDPMSTFPLRAQTAENTGRVQTTIGGSGVEFFSTREYRHGDPISRIDWNRRARTGELTTIEFREERAARTVLVVDTRETSYVGDAADESALEHQLRAAGQVAAALLNEDNPVGLAPFGPRWAWVAPGLGRNHEMALRRTLGLSPAFPPTPAEEAFYPVLTFRRFREHLPGDAQVVLLTPLLDDYANVVARRFEAYGHAVTVVSPDVTDPSTPGGVVTRLERKSRLSGVRDAGVRVVDWDPETRLAVAVAAAQRGWRR